MTTTEYATEGQLKSYVTIDDGIDDTLLRDAIATASRDIDNYCGRSFGKAETATARSYRPAGPGLVKVNDFWTTEDLVVSVDGATWTTGAYQLEPLNGVVDGEEGWPYSELHAIGGSRFPRSVDDRASVQVTAKWGWADVPAPVHQACLIIAAEAFKLKDAPFGVAGFGDYGVVRIRNNPIAASKLAPYRTAAAAFQVA